MTKDIKTTELIRTSQSWDGALLPDFPQGQPELRVVRLDFPIGAKTGWHHHSVVNYGIVQQGDLTIVCQDGTEKTFHEGEALVEVIGTIHRGENRGSKPVILNMFYFSSPGTEITIQHPSRVQQQDRKDQTAPLIGEGDLLLGRLGLPDRLPFSKPKVNWLLHRSPQESKIIGDPNRKANKIDARVQKLLLVIGKQALPRRQIMADLGLRQKSRKSLIDNYLKPAYSQGYIDFAYPNSPNKPEQAYKLTAKGLEQYKVLTSFEG